MPVLLRPISPSAADAVLGGRAPEGLRLAEDYPTEFSTEVAARVADGGDALGPYFIHRAGDDVVVGEIGGTLVGAGVVETGYAVVASCWGRGYATDALRALVALARERGDVARIVAHAPVDRPASGRVLEKAGFELIGESAHEHDGVTMRVGRWELALDRSAAPGAASGSTPLLDDGSP